MTIDLTKITVDPSSDYTTKEVSALTGIPVPTIHGWISAGKVLNTGKRGRHLTFDAPMVEAMIAIRLTGVSVTKTGAPPRKKAVASATLAASVKESLLAGPDVPAGHVAWNVGTPTGPKKSETFGPFDIDVVRDNTEEGASMVPSLDPDFVFDAGEEVVLANALKSAEPTWAYGPSGSGKTSGIRQICALTNWPLYRINMHADVSVADFVGTTEVVIDPETGNAVTKFVNGVLIRAMLNGGVLLIDEVTATPAHILLVLQAVLERAENPAELWAEGRTHTTFLNSQTGETIHAHPRFRIVVTDNTNGQGDVTGSFAGTNVMNEATRSRFTQWLYKSYPEEAAWRSMLRAKTGVSAEVARAIVDVAVDVNKGSAQLGANVVTSGMVINPRDTLAVARLAKTFGDVGIAFKVGVVNSMNPGDPDRVFATDLIKAKLTGI